MFSGRAPIGITDPAARRLWRLRKHHQWVDAELREPDERDGVTLNLYYNGTLTYERRWVTRALALDEAARRRLDLEREGWIPHW